MDFIVSTVTVFVDDETKQSQLSLSDLPVNEICGLTQKRFSCVNFVGNYSTCLEYCEVSVLTVSCLACGFAPFPRNIASRCFSLCVTRLLGEVIFYMICSMSLYDMKLKRPSLTRLGI